MLGAAVKFANPPELMAGSSGATVDAASLTAKDKGVVVSVMPLYIIVTDGHMLAENGPPDLGKQYCSTMDTADTVARASSGNPSLQLHRALNTSRSSDLIIAKDLCAYLGGVGNLI